MAEGKATAVQADGKILVAGFATLAGADSFAVARLNAADGSLDTTFGTGGVKTFANVATFGAGTTTAHANAIAVQSDGKIVVAGSANPTVMVGVGTETVAVLRLNATDGSLDPSFGTAGVKTFSLVTTFGVGTTAAEADGMAIAADGTIVLAGTANPHGTTSMIVLSMNPTNGSLDPAFGTNGVLIIPPSTFGVATSAQAAAVALQSNGKIVIAGQANPGGTTEMALARINPMFGTLDGSFGTGGVVTIAPSAFGAGATTAAASAVRVQSNGAIVVGGLANPSATLSMGVARLLTNGNLDPSFGTAGTVVIAPSSFGGTIAFLNALLAQSDGTIIAAGSSNPGGTTTVAFAQLQANGSVTSATAVPIADFGSLTTGAETLAMASQQGKPILVGDANPGGTQSFNIIRLSSTATARADALTLAILAAYCPNG